MKRAWTLFRKDLRLLRAPLIAGVILAVCTHGCSLPPAYYALAYKDAPPNGQYPPGDALMFLTVLAVAIAVALTPLIAAAAGGLSFARERRDRSAEFLAMLPVSRVRVAASKVTAGAACVLLPAATYILVAVFAARTVASTWPDARRSLAILETGMLYHGAMALLLFACAWACSSVSRSSAVSAAIGATAGVLVLFCFGTLAWSRDPVTRDNAFGWQAGELVWGMITPGSVMGVPAWVRDGAMALMVGSAAVALIVGAAAYVRRVEP